MGRKMRPNRVDLYHTTRLHGRIHWQPRSHRSQGSGARSFGVQLKSRDMGDARCVSKVKRSSATRPTFYLGSVHGPVASVFQASQFAQSYRKQVILHRLPLDLAEVLTKLEAVLDKPRSSRSLEEEFGVDPGVAATEAEYIEALMGSGSGGEGLQ